MAFILFFVICILLTGGCIFYCSKQEEEAVEKTIETKNTNPIPIENVVEYNEKITKDLRLHYYNCIQLNNKLRAGDYIDIRISFANGMDFIILPKKKIMDMSVGNMVEGKNETTLWIYISEEEILRMSSAMVDQKQIGGSVIYAVKYVQSSQERAFANYPVNEEVKSLIKNCPNIVVKEKIFVESSLRKEIERSGEITYQKEPVSEEKVYSDKVEDTAANGNNPYEQEVIYFD